MTKRNSGIELLRVVLMLMIILGHLFCHTGIRTEYALFEAEWLFMWGVQTITVSAVNCFVLIMGFFMIDSEFKTTKAAQLWGKVWFYSITIFVILTAAKLSPFTTNNLLDAVFPVLRGEYWFFTCYILLYLLVPFLNAGVHGMSERTLKYSLGIILAFFYIMPVFAAVFHQYDPEEGMSILGFMTLYFVGAAIKKLRVNLSPLACILGLLGNSVVVFLSKVALELIVEQLELGLGTGLFYHYNTITQIINAALLLLLFQNISVSPAVQPAISSLASATFSVYLIHEHPLVRQLLWQTGLNRVLHKLDAIEFVIVCMCIPFGVFGIAYGIDYCRQMFIKVFFKRPIYAIKIDSVISYLKKLDDMIM